MLSTHPKYFRSCGAALAIACACEIVGRNFLLSVANAQEQLPSVQGTAFLPRDLSPWGMFMNADVVVKVVMVGLVIASIVTWTVWLAKTIELMKARRQVRAALLTPFKSCEMSKPLV
jgi:hypothetical protein